MRRRVLATPVSPASQRVGTSDNASRRTESYVPPGAGPAYFGAAADRPRRHDDTVPAPDPQPPRVLHVAHYCLPHIGGLETVVAAETQGLAARGWDVSLLSSAWGAPAGRAVEDGVRTVRVRAWNGLEPRFGVPFPVFSPWLLVALWREVRRADVVHVHDPLYLTSWVAAFWCLLLRTPYVVHRHVGFVHHSSLVVRLVQRLVLGTFARLVLARRRRRSCRSTSTSRPGPAPPCRRRADRGARQRRRHRRASDRPCPVSSVGSGERARPARSTGRSRCSSAGSCPRRGSPTWRPRRATTTTSSSSAATGRPGSTTRGCTSSAAVPADGDAARLPHAPT